MTRRAAAWLLVLLTVVAARAGEARADEDPPPGTAEVLAGLAEPAAAQGFYVRGIQELTQGGRSLSLPVTITAFPVREGDAWAWSLRQEARRKPLLSVEEMVAGRDHRPIRGSVRSEQGAQKQSLQWRLEDGEIRYEFTAPDGTAHRGSAPATGPVIGNGAGLVLFLRQLHPRTGTYTFSLLAPDVLVAFGLVPMKMEVAQREHDGRPAYVGEAVLPNALRILVALDPESGALRSLETHVMPQDTRSRLLDIRDHGAAEVHNQTAAALERQGALQAALREAQAARAADSEESGYPLRVGTLHRKLAAKEGAPAARHSHLVQAAEATRAAADLIGEGLRNGRLSRDDAASFQAMRAGLYQQAGNDLLEVLASDRKAKTLADRRRIDLELAAAEVLLAGAELEPERREEAIALAAKVARGFAEQNIMRLEPAYDALAAVAVRAHERLAELRPRDAQVWQDLGTSCYLASRHADAIRALEKSLALRPRSPAARVWYGAALWHGGRQAEAREQLAILERVGARQQAASLRQLTGMP